MDFFLVLFFRCKETQLIQNFAITCTIKFLAGKAMFDNTQNKPNFIHFNDLIRISLQYFFGQLIKNSESFTFPLMINYRKSRREEVEYQFVQKNLCWESFCTKITISRFWEAISPPTLKFECRSNFLRFYLFF